MVIFQPLVAEGFEWINTCDHEDYEVFATFDGQPRAQSWRPIKVRRVRADDRSAFNPSDFPWLGGHALVMRQKAVDRLRDILDAHGEVLPLVTDDEVDLFVFNARVVDALDEARTLVTMIPGTNRILHLEKVAFIEPAVRGLDIFRLPHRAGETYVSEHFVDRVKAAELVGLKFEKVWSSA